MKLRRVRTPSGLQTQQFADGQWRPTDSLLPFAPLSFRDFLLSEAHNVNASPAMMRARSAEGQTLHHLHVGDGGERR